MDQDPDQDEKKPPADDKPFGGRPEAAAEAAFDLWLTRSLQQLYGGVTAEPIPPELLRLIAADRDTRSS